MYVKQAPALNIANNKIKGLHFMSFPVCSLPGVNMYTAPMPIAEPRALVLMMKIKAIKLILPFALGSNAAAPVTEQMIILT